ncbi:hypothetical protein F4V57_01080 [Acinetobacter qingfengensis]|uniref:Uncharacterized protein n=1 Tax=Acinetobacter qingfengensis TaxID=1262585 RepID=A0A1E7R9C5_9GAMM|nr:hypothetical protein F4V57_01080 [Acinetobacter qingfengensis]OEY95928.1 hypothetical protein BJI46_03160 [Acinetobacter qingfengensis]
MQHINSDLIDTEINICEKFKIKPSKIIIGYQTYDLLMHDPIFSDQVLRSSANPNKRRYRNIRIKLTQRAFQIEVV